MSFSTLLVANRGEIACRVIRGAHEMGIRCVAVYVDADAQAPFVADADEAVRLPGGYLDGKSILDAARATGAGAIHPAYGFLAESAGFAADGYAAIAPAVFDRIERGIELDYDDAGKVRGRELRAELGWEGPMADVEAAAGALEPLGNVGVVGYCWGGSLAWLAACRLDVACAVGYYGGQIIGFNDETPRCPVILHFGETDASIPMDDVDAIRAAHPDVPVHVYGDAGHGFNCDRRGSYHAESAKTARARTLAFFAEHLG